MMRGKERGAERRLFYDRCGRWVFVAAASMMTVIIFAIILFVGKQGLMTFADVSPAEFFFSAEWDPLRGHHGALTFILGSVAVTVMALVFSAPPGILGAVFLAKIAPSGLRTFMKPAVDLYAAIPSVVYGYLGMTILMPFLSRVFDVYAPFGLLAASLVLSVMLLPTILSISADAIRAVPKPLEEASLALGATWWQTMVRVVIPAARPGILTAVILAMARAVGETMAVQMLIGNTPQLIRSFFTPTAALTSNIVVEMGNTPFGSTWGNALFLMAFALLVISLLMILFVRRFGRSQEV